MWNKQGKLILGEKYPQILKEQQIPALVSSGLYIYFRCVKAALECNPSLSRNVHLI